MRRGAVAPAIGLLADHFAEEAVLAEFEEGEFAVGEHAEGDDGGLGQVRHFGDCHEGCGVVPEGLVVHEAEDEAAKLEKGLGND